MNMNLCKYLPSGYTSWFALYQEAKKHFRLGLDYVEWVELPTVVMTRSMLAAHVNAEGIAYSIRYLEQQALAELVELREIETFNKKELEILYYAMQHLLTYNGSDIDVVAVNKKVGDLLTDKRKKLRR